MTLTNEHAQSTADTVKKVDYVLQHPMSETEAMEALGVREPAQGIAYFQLQAEFEVALRYVKSQFPWITEEWVQETLEHEEEHLDEARKRFAGRCSCEYALKVINMNNGNLGIGGAFKVVMHGMTQEEMDSQHRNAILGAPKNLSASDRIRLGDPDADISDENGWHLSPKIHALS